MEFDSLTLLVFSCLLFIYRRAHARLEHHDAELFDALVPYVIASLPRFRAQALANLAWAFAACRHDSPELFDALAEQVGPRKASKPLISP